MAEALERARVTPVLRNKTQMTLRGSSQGWNSVY